MGRERQIRLERKEIRQELVSKRRTRRRAMMLFVIAILLGVGAGVAWGYNRKHVQPAANNAANTTANETSNKASASADLTKAANATNNATNSTKPDKQMITATIKTDKGDIVLALDHNAAPKTVDNFVKLANEHFYDGTTFHRVIADFMIQGGDPLSKDSDPSNDGTGGPGYKFDDEINPRSLGVAEDVIKSYEAQGYKYNYDLQSIKIDPGVIAMANSGPNTNGSQFFIVTTQPQAHLYGKHTGFGRVTTGMDVVLKIAQGDKINSIQIAQ